MFDTRHIVLFCIAPICCLCTLVIGWRVNWDAQGAFLVLPLIVVMRIAAMTSFVIATLQLKNPQLRQHRKLIGTFLALNCVVLAVLSYSYLQPLIEAVTNR